MSPSKDYLTRLLAYDRWANREALESVRDTRLHRSRKLVGHIVSVEWIWLSRLTRSEHDGSMWPEWSFDECAEQLDKLDSAWAECIATAERNGGNARAAYKVKNKPYEVDLTDVITHVVVHSSYHRGQIAVDQRLAGQGPPFTDFMECIQRGELR